jgi:starch synthase
MTRPWRRGGDRHPVLPVDAASLENAMARATRLFADRNLWRSLQRRGMRTDVSWTRSAAAYAALYHKLHKAS